MAVALPSAAKLKGLNGSSPIVAILASIAASSAAGDDHEGEKGLGLLVPGRDTLKNHANAMRWVLR